MSRDMMSRAVGLTNFFKQQAKVIDEFSRGSYSGATIFDRIFLLNTNRRRNILNTFNIRLGCFI